MRLMRSLIAACSSEMGGGAGLLRSRSSSSTASIRRLSRRIVCPCLPPRDMRPPLRLLQHGPKLLQLPLQLVLLAYPSLHLQRSQPGVGYLVGHGGCRPLHPALQHGGVEVLEQLLELPDLGVVAGTSGLGSGPLAVLGAGGIVGRTVVAAGRSDAPATLPVPLYGATSCHQ